MSDMARYLAIEFYNGDDIAGEELLYDTINKLLLKNAKKPLDDIANFEAYLRTATKYHFLDEKEKAERKSRLNNFQNGNLDLLASDNLSEDEPSEEQKQIVNDNMATILKHLENYLSRYIARRVIFARYKEKSFSIIAKELCDEGFKNRNGDDYTEGNLRKIYHDALRKLRQVIKDKYPNFKTELILKYRDNE